MSSAIGDGSGQGHIIGPRTEGSGYGSKPSLPIFLRHADPLAGPWRAGEFLQGASAPLSRADAQLLNRHYNYPPPTGLPPSAEELGPFLANVDPNRNLSFHSFLCGDAGRAYFLKALMHFDNHGPHSTLGVGLADIASAFGSPGAGNHALIATLTHWAQRHPGVRGVLDDAVEALGDRIPRNNVKEPT